MTIPASSGNNIYFSTCSIRPQVQHRFPTLEWVTFCVRLIPEILGDNLCSTQKFNFKLIHFISRYLPQNGYLSAYEAASNSLILLNKTETQNISDFDYWI